MYADRIYKACTIAGDSEGRYWCAINSKNVEMKGTGKWVWCNSKTSSTGAKKCKIPFKYKGSTYYACTTADHHSMWCHFEEKAGSWGIC